MKLKDLPKYCKSHWCLIRCGNQPKCEYENICREFCHSTMPMYLCNFLNNLETDIRKDDEE